MPEETEFSKPLSHSKGKREGDDIQPLRIWRVLEEDIMVQAANKTGEVQMGNNGSQTKRNSPVILSGLTVVR